MNLKIAHAADIQINVGESTYHRKREYELALENLRKSLISENIDVLMVPGDVFERFKTTDIERAIWTSFVHKLLREKSDIHIIVTDGNHDIRRRGFDYFDGNDQANHIHVLEEVNTSINHPRYHYTPRAKMLRIDDQRFKNVLFACWSEIAKHVPDYGDVSPWQQLSSEHIDQLKRDNLIFDLYHGTISGAKDMGNNHELKADTVRFYGDIVALGHIHQYQQIGNAFYSSSLVPRAFNEGMRIHNGQVIYDYLDKHGYIIYDIDDSVVTHRFIPIHVSVKPVSVIIDHLTTVEHVKQLMSLANARVNFKLVLDKPNPEATAYLYDMVSRVSSWNITKVEATNLSKAKHIDTPEIESKKLDLTFEAFEPVFKELLIQNGCDEHVQKRVLEICKQECGFHLHPESSSTVDLISFSANNFLTLKDAHVDFNGGLTRISANNGEGKTSIIKGILFAVTGLTHGGVNRNALKQYHMTLFNDKMVDQDILRVSLRYTVNNQEFEVKHTLQRLRNGDGHITKIEHTTEILDVQRNEIIHRGENAINILISTFGDFKAFSLMHVLNVENLAYLKTLTGQDFVNFLLSRLGYNSVLMLQQFVNGAKHGELQKYPSVSNLSSVQMLADKQSEEANVAELTKKIDQGIQHVQTISLSGAEKELEISNLIKENPILQDIDKHQQDYSKFLSDLSVSFASIGQQAPVVTVDTMTQASLSIMREIDKFSDLKATQDIKETEYSNWLVGYTKQLNEAIERNKAIDIKIDEFSRKVRLSVQQKYDDAKNLHTNLVTKLNHLNTEIIDLEKQKTQENHSISLLCMSKDVTKNRIIQLEKEIQSLNAGECHECQSNIAHKHGEMITKKSEELSLDLALTEKQTNEINTKETLVAEIQTKLSSTIESRDALQIQANDAKAVMDDIDTKLAKFNQPGYAKILYQANYPNEVIEHEMMPLEMEKPVHIDYTALIQKHQEAKKLCDEGYELARQFEAFHIANEQLTKLKQEALIIANDITDKNSEIQSNREKRAVANDRIERLSIDSVKQQEHEFAVHCCKIYGHLVKDWLPGYLYDQAKSAINHELSKFDAPGNLLIQLSNNMYGQLVLIDRNETQQIIERPVSFGASGMESTFALLHLATSLRRVNPYKQVRLTMLDELSGPLHNGTEKNPVNYLQYFNELLAEMSKDSQLLVIDQRIEDDIFNNFVTVTKDKLTGLSITI